MSNDPLAYLKEQLDELEAAGFGHPSRARSRASSTPRARFDGRDVINLASNNYLGLAAHPRLKEAAAKAAMRVRRGLGRRPDDRRDHVAAPRAGAAVRRVQGRRGGADVPVGLHRRTPGRSPRSCRPRTSSSPTS